MRKSTQYSIAAARSNFSAVVDQAEAGQEIELTRRGKPVAVLISLQQFERLRGDRQSFAVAYQDFLSHYTLKDFGLDANFSESIRSKDVGREFSL